MTKREEFAAHWRIVLGGLIGVFTGAWAFPFFILGPLVDPFQAELGWSRTSIVACATFMSLGQVIGTPTAGRLADRFGVRRTAMISMLLLTLCFSAITMVGKGVWQLQGIYFLIGLLGAGCGGVTYTRAIGGWFHSGRGLALGIVLSGTGAASFLAPMLVDALTGLAGWRSACFAVAGLTLFVGLPVVFFLLAEAPRTAQPAPVVEKQRAPAPTHDFTRGEALRDVRFWMLCMSTIALGLFFASLLIHLMPMLTDAGVPHAQAARIASINGITMVAGRLIAGPLLDRFGGPVVGAMMFLLGAAGAAAFVAIGPGAAIFMVASIGILIGAEMDLISFMVLHYFGLRSYGVLFGIVFGVYSAAGMMTPLVSKALISLGGYPALYGGAAISFLIAATLFILLGMRSLMRRPAIEHAPVTH